MEVKVRGLFRVPGSFRVSGLGAAQGEGSRVSLFAGMQLPLLQTMWPSIGIQVCK